MTTTTFSKTRLAIARMRRGLKKKNIAEDAKISRQSLSLFESGESVPSKETVARLADVLGFPEAFFYGPDLEIMSHERPSFRSLSTMTSGQRDAALAAGVLAFEVNRLLEEEFDLPEVTVPDMRGVEPEAAAAALRAMWGIGDEPIDNVVLLLEEHGVRVFSLVEDNEQVDAYAVWQGQRPFVFLNTMKTGERGRFDGCHELGHIVLHRSEKPQGREAEHEANRFASAFLMPDSSVVAMAPALNSLHDFFPIKKKFKVSVAAVIHRLNQLGMMTEWEYRQLFIELSVRDWRKNEPAPRVPRETSGLWQDVFTALREDGTTINDLAHRLNIKPSDLQHLVFHLVPGIVPADVVVPPPADEDNEPPPIPRRLELVRD